MDRFYSFFLPLDRGYIDMTVVSGLVLREVRITLAIRTQTFNIQLLDDHRTGALETLARSQYIAVLCDVRTAGEDHIGRRFAYARRRIYIAAMHTCTLLLDHLFAEDMLADDTVGRREVEDDLCALDR